MLKLMFVLSALAATTIAAQAQTYDPGAPVCLHVFGELAGERVDCIYASLAQCAASASGRPATCVVNPYFAGAAVPSARKGRRHVP